MNQHTPGPWTITGQSEAGKYITVKARGGRTVARVPWCKETDGINATDDGDAHLIAAAPDLLDALYKIDANAAESVEWLRRVAREAIAKAEGR